VIETALPTSTTEELPSPAPLFRVDSPAVNPFVTPGPISFTRTDDHLGLAWDDEAIAPDNRESVRLAEDFVSQSRRDVERYPNSPRSLANLGAALMAAGREAEAVEAFGMAVAIDPANYTALAHLARVHLLRDELDAAATFAGTLRVHYPTDPVPSLILGCVAVRRGDVETAVRELKSAANADRNSTLPHYLLGMVLLGAHREREAIAQLRAAIRLDEHSPALQRGLGVAFASIGDLGRAIRAFRTSLALDPRAPETVHALGRVLLQRGDTDSAVNLLAEFAARFPSDRVAQELLADAYRKQEQFRSAKKHLLNALGALDGDSSPEAGIERGRLMNNVGAASASLGDLAEAERWYLRALGNSPHPVIYRNLFGVYSLLQQKASAARLLAAWRTDFPNDDVAALHWAAEQFDTSNQAQSISELRRLTQSVTVSARAYSTLGTLLADHLRDMEAATSVLEEGFGRFPDSSLIANNLAYVYLMRGMPTRARQILETAHSDDIAESVHITATWGLLCLWEGDVVSARRYYESAARIAQGSGLSLLAKTARQKMHLELARFFIRNKNTEQAKLEVRAGLMMGGNKRYKEDLLTIRDSLQLSGPSSEAIPDPD